MTKAKVVAFVPDLMDRSRFGSIADVTFVKSAQDLVELARDADIVVLDLGRPGAIDVVSSLPPVKKIGFVSHVDTETIAAAKNAGVEDVLPRSRFFSQLVTLLTK